MRWMASALWHQQWDCSVTAVSTDLETRRNPGPNDHRRPGDTDTYITTLNIYGYPTSEWNWKVKASAEPLHHLWTLLDFHLWPSSHTCSTSCDLKVEEHLVDSDSCSYS